VAGVLVARTGERPALQALVDATGLPFSTMLMGKSVLDEDQPGYVGVYNGALMNHPVRDFVESRDCVVLVGAPLTDLNTGAFTAKLDPARTIAIGHHHVRVGGQTFAGVEMGELLALLARRAQRRAWPTIAARSLGPVEARASDDIDAPTLYSRWEAFLETGDIVVVETGTVSMGLGFARLPSGATYHNQTLWGSIGWATPAAFGAAVAAPDRRIVLITGEGAHQFTVQEISQFQRFGMKPVIFVLNNGGYLIERLLCKDPAAVYNDVAAWRYAELPKGFGAEGWMTARVATCGELDAAMAAASRADRACYVEVVTDAYAASPLAEKLHEAVGLLHKD
jgi:indolepyruvate decarboxylase